MEYRRRRKNTRRRRGGYQAYSAAGGRGESGGGFGLLILLLLMGGIIYVLFATSVGSWLTESVFGRKHGGNTLATTEPAGATPGLSFSNPQTQKMHFSGLDMYALRLGSFESDAEASALSASVRALGAAGCIIYNGDGSVSVFASAYTTEAGAESVRKRLVEQGYKAEIVPFACEPVEIEVTAEAERLDGIAEAVGFSFGIINDLNNEVINYDTAERGIEYGKAIGSELLENIRSLRSALNGVHDGRGVIDALDEYYMQLTALVTAFNSAETQNRVELSGLLKNLQIGAIKAYMNMLNAVADM